MASMSAREFNQNVSKATRIADEEPVFVTRRGKVEYVLISIEEYEGFKKEKLSLYEALQMPEVEDIELEIAPREIEPFREVFD